MAYSTPTTPATDPAIPSETNTALASVNLFITNCYTDSIAAFRVIREYVRLEGGNVDEFDAAAAPFGAPGNTDPTVSTSPDTQAQANSAYALLTGYMDTFTSRFNRVIGATRAISHRRSGLLATRTIHDNVGATLGTATTAITMASDPVTKAHMDGGLASATTDVNNINTSLLAILRAFQDIFRLGIGNPYVSANLDSVIATIVAH